MTIIACVKHIKEPTITPMWKRCLFITRSIPIAYVPIKKPNHINFYFSKSKTFKIHYVETQPKDKNNEWLARRKWISQTLNPWNDSRTFLLLSPWTYNGNDDHSLNTNLKTGKKSMESSISLEKSNSLKSCSEWDYPSYQIDPPVSRQTEQLILTT